MKKDFSLMDVLIACVVHIAANLENLVENVMFSVVLLGFLVIKREIEITFD